MDDVVIEPVGGFVGGASPTGNLRMEGRVAWSALSAADQERVNKILDQNLPVNANLRYRITREGKSGGKSAEAPPELVPQALIDSVTTTLK